MSEDAQTPRAPQDAGAWASQGAQTPPSRSDAVSPADHHAPDSTPEDATPASSVPLGKPTEPTPPRSGSTPPSDQAPDSTPEDAAPAPRVPLDKPAADPRPGPGPDPRPQPDPWASPEETASSLASGATHGPAHDQSTGAPTPGGGTPGTGTPGTGTPNPPPWDNPNPFAPPAGHTPYPQPAPGQHVPPPPMAPGGPGQPPYGYAYPAYAPQQVPYPGVPGYGGWPAMPLPPSNGMGTAALILGIASAALFCMWPLTIVMGILGVVFGAIGRRKAGRGEATNGGQALAGIICGAVGIVLSIALVVFFVVVVDDTSSDTDSGTDGDGFSTSLVVEHPDHLR